MKIYFLAIGEQYAQTKKTLEKSQSERREKFIRKKMAEYEITLKKKFIPDWEKEVRQGLMTATELEETIERFRSLHKHGLEEFYEKIGIITNLESNIKKKYGKDVAYEICENIIDPNLDKFCRKDLDYIVIKVNALLKQNVTKEIFEKEIKALAKPGIYYNKEEEALLKEIASLQSASGESRSLIKPQATQATTSLSHSYRLFSTNSEKQSNKRRKQSMPQQKRPTKP